MLTKCGILPNKPKFHILKEYPINSKKTIKKKQCLGEHKPSPENLERNIGKLKLLNAIYKSNSGVNAHFILRGAKSMETLCTSKLSYRDDLQNLLTYLCH